MFFRRIKWPGSSRWSSPFWYVCVAALAGVNAPEDISLWSTGRGREIRHATFALRGLGLCCSYVTGEHGDGPAGFSLTRSLFLDKVPEEIGIQQNEMMTLQV